MRLFFILASFVCIAFAGARGATPLPSTGRGWGWGEGTSGIDPGKFEPLLPSPTLRPAAINHQKPACCVTPTPYPSPQGGGDSELAQKIALGANLFSDPRLSKDGTMSCASCHDPKQAFTNPKPPVRPGVTDNRLRRDIPSLLNVAFFAPLHHDGGEPTLEMQILAPLFNEAEMANTTFDELTNRLAAIPEYREAFATVFRSAPTIETLGQALAAYERSLLAADSPFDRWRFAHNDDAVSLDAKTGFGLYGGKAGCSQCHTLGETAAPFTTNVFLNTGIGYQSEARRAAETPNALADRGREEVTHSRDDRYKFRTPTLRNVELTAPYMHDGSLKTLEDVVAYYNAGGSSDPDKDPRISPLGLSETEQKELVAFLKSLTAKEMPGAQPGIHTPKP